MANPWDEFAGTSTAPATTDEKGPWNDYAAPAAATPTASDPAPAAAPWEESGSQIKTLAEDDNFDPAAHAAQNPDDAEMAYQVQQARKNAGIGAWMARAGRTLSKPQTYLKAGQGVVNFLGGLGQAILVDPISHAYYSATGDPRAQTKQAEATLEAQHGEQSVKGLVNAAISARPGVYNGGFGENSGEIDTRTPEDIAKEEDTRQRALFDQRVQQARNEIQLSKGQPLDTGAIASLYNLGNQTPSEEVGPEALAAAGAPPVDPAAIERASAAGDPTMLALAAAPAIPGASYLGGRIAQGLGKAAQVPMNAIEAGARAIPPLGTAGKVVAAGAGAGAAIEAAPTILHHPVIAAAAAGVKGLQVLGRAAEAQGKELATGVPSELTTKAATAAATGQSAIGANIQRKLGDFAAHGATTAVGMAPLNLALSEGDPQKFVESEAGAGAFGGTFGAFARNRPMLVEAARPFLRSEGARALAEAGEGNDALAAKSAAYVMSLPDEARDRTLETIGAIQGLPTNTPDSQTRAKVYVLNDTDYRNVIEQKFGMQQAAMGGGRGFYIGDDGAAYVNGDYHSGLDPSELGHTVGHEFGGHAAINIMQAMGAKGGAIHEGLMNAARQALFLKNGNPTPDFNRFVNEYNLRFDPTGATKRLDLSSTDPEARQEAVDEFISEQAGQLLADKGAGELALPQTVQDRINDRVGQFLGKIVGVDTRKVGTPTHFSREEVGALSKTVQDTLSQVVGMKLRGGAEIPEAPKTDTTRMTELQGIIDQPRPPTGSPVEAVHAWIATRRAAQRELTALQEGTGLQTPASGPAPKAPSAPAIVSPPDVTGDALKALSVMGLRGPQAKSLIRQANEQHGAPITNAQQLAAGAFRIHGGGSVKPGEFVPKPAAPPVPVPVPQDATFRDELGATHKVTGAAPGAPRIGDIVATREGEIRRITRLAGDTVDTARPIDPLNARGTKTHKLADIQPLQHDYTEPGTSAPGSTPESTKPTMSVQPKGDRFIVVDGAGNPVSNNTFATERDAQQSIRQQGKGKFSIFPNPTDSPDVIDTIQQRVPGIYFGGMSKEEAESFIGDKYLRDRLSTSNPAYGPDEVLRNIQPTPEEPIDHRVSSIAELGSRIEEAYRQRKSLADQQTAADKAAAKANKNAPNEPAEPEPSTDAEGQDNIPPEPAVATAVSEGPTPAEEPAPLSPADVDQIAAQAEQAVVAARAGTKKKAHTAAKEITDAQVDAVAAAHEQSVPANYQGVKLRRDALGKETISGTFNPARPFDAFLLNQADLSPKHIGILQDLQGKIGQTVTVNYGHAPEGEETVTAGSRRKAQGESTAQARASGEAPTQNEDKNIVPLEVRFNKGSDTPSITILGASPEKLLSNFNHLAAVLTEFGEPVPYRDIHDPHLVADMKGVARNHANNVKADGSAPIEGFPDNPTAAPDPDYKPYVIPKDRADFINIILGDESAKTGVKGASPTQKLKQGLAAKNNIAMNAQGEVNGLRDALNAAKGPVTNPDGTTTTWSKATIENPLSEALRVDLINEVHPEVKNEDASIRPHGYQGDIGRFFAEGAPNRTFTAAGFLPDTGPKKPRLPKAKRFDWLERNKFVGEDFAGPPNSVVIQIRDLDSRPIGDGHPIILPLGKDMDSTAASVFSGYTKAIDEVGGSLRESLVKVLDANGRSIAQMEYTPDGMKVAEQSALDDAREKYARYTASSSKDQPQERLNFMPDTGATKTAQEKARERITAQRAIITASAIREADGGQLARADRGRGDRVVKEQRSLLYMPTTEATDRVSPYLQDAAQDPNMQGAAFKDSQGDRVPMTEVLSDLQRINRPDSRDHLEEYVKWLQTQPQDQVLYHDDKESVTLGHFASDLDWLTKGEGASPSFMPDDRKPTPAGGTPPAGQQPSGSQSVRLSTGGTSKEDTGKPEEGETPGERLMREAEAAGLAPSIETMKGVLRGDTHTMDKLRRMILDKTGRPARFMPDTPRKNAKQAARDRLAKAA